MMESLIPLDLRLASSCLVSFPHHPYQYCKLGEVIGTLYDLSHQRRHLFAARMGDARRSILLVVVPAAAAGMPYGSASKLYAFLERRRDMHWLTK
jgi:hypothetical protein